MPKPKSTPTPNPQPDSNPDFELRFNVNDDPEKYKEFIEDLRRQAANATMPDVGIPTLPVPPPQPPRSSQSSQQPPVIPRVFDVILDTGSDTNPQEGDRSLRVRIQRHDLYVIGFRTEYPNAPGGRHDAWYEFNNDGNDHLIPQATHFFGCNGSYPELERVAGRIKREEITLNQQTLSQAVRNLTNSELVGNDLRRVRDMNVLARAMIIVIQMISESARFVPILNRIYDSWYGGDFRLLDYAQLETDWGTLSREFRSGRRLTQHVGETVPIITLLALLLLTHYTRDSGSRSNYQAFDMEATVDQDSALTTAANAPTVAFAFPTGRALAEIFSVRILDIDNESPGDLYGTITATDARNSYVIYSRDKKNPKAIYPGEFATLTGPGRALSAADNFRIDIDLWDHDTLSPDDSISRGQIEWNAYDFTNTYDEVRETVIRSDDGSAQLRWAVMSDAAEAQITVILINGDKEDPANVYGSVHAENTSFGGEITIFDRGSDNYVDVHPERRIPLERSSVVVPVDATLKIRTDLWDYDSLSPDDAISQGTAEFKPRLFFGSEVKTIVGRNGMVDVQVQWL